MDWGVVGDSGRRMPEFVFKTAGSQVYIWAGYAPGDSGGV